MGKLDKLTKSFGVVHGLVECEDCGWKSESYKNAQATAAIHARRYGHKVLVEITISGSYNGHGLIEGKIGKQSQAGGK